MMDGEHGRFPLKSLALLFGRVVVPAARRKVEAGQGKYYPGIIDASLVSGI
jgi:hypothetical protein